MYNNRNGFLDCNDGCGDRRTGRFPAEPCGPRFPPNCGSNGCFEFTDSSCIIYHKNFNITSGLINLNLPNGTPVQLILETIDAQLGQFNGTNWLIPYLRSITLPFSINNLPQFAAAVDTEFSVIAGEIAALQLVAALPNSSTDTPTVHFILTGTLDRNISANVKVSATSGNQLTIQPDGLYSQAQNLSIDYAAHTLSITDGNTVDFTSILGIGWKGNVATDPVSPPDGSYWWNTTSSTLKIAVDGGVIKTIPTI
jgi:hypothetical protein